MRWKLSMERGYSKRRVKIPIEDLVKEWKAGSSTREYKINNGYNISKKQLEEMKTKLEQYQALLFTKLYVDLNKPIEELAKEKKKKAHTGKNADGAR